MNLKINAEKAQKLVYTIDNVSEWRVLVVDDVEDNIAVLTAILELKGATVEQARGGVEGVEKALNFLPNLILLDLAMPEVDGWDMKHLIDSTPIISHIPVIAVTAHQSSNVCNQLEQEGFAGMIAKPFNVRTLISDICDMIA